jgi:putative PIN family toxin of toxin-antitoxin system
MPRPAHPALTSADVVAAPDAPVMVLDTNVVLDWLLFKQATCATLAVGIQTRQWAWHATAPMRVELACVLARPQLARWNPDCERILSVFDQWAELMDAVPPAPACTSPRCRDPDDQKFIDLALRSGARWLLSRDRALLDLARPARARGLEIQTPAEWLGCHPPAQHPDIAHTEA